MADEKVYPFFANRECPNFPCHPVKNLDEFNCAFCYCPLYALGAECGGNFEYTEKGVKSCINCAAPHLGTNGVQLVADHWPQLKEMALKKD